MPINYDKNIEGWFNFSEIYQEAVEAAPQEGAHFVELGVLKGASTSYMASLIYDSKKNIRFDAVDWFKGSEEHKTMSGVFPAGLDDETTRTAWLYELAKSNLKPAIDLGIVNLVKKSVKEAIVEYPDQSLDFVYHDAGHEYEDLMEELPVIWKKIKPGGYLAGHDYSNWGFIGVSRAVNLFAERAGRLHVTFRSGEDTWIIRKPLTDNENSKLETIPQTDSKEIILNNLKACIKMLEQFTVQQSSPHQQDEIQEIQSQEILEPKTKPISEDAQEFSYLI